MVRLSALLLLASLWSGAVSFVVNMSSELDRRHPLPSSFKWTSTDILIAPKNDSRQLAGVKDPSVVYYKGKWHIFATTAKSNNWNMFYTSFADWSKANDAEFFYLDQSPIGEGYRAAPQVFYFAPQKLWYLVYQNGNAAYSTNPDIGNPAGWTAPKTFYSGMPKIVEEHIGEGYWLDMWVICDSKNCHLFSSDDNGQLYRSQTPVSKFPEGFSEPVIALQDRNRFRLFEGSNVYKLGDKKEDGYLLIVEAIGTDERRWFRSWTMPSIEGPYTPLAAEEENPFARANNVAGVAWSKDISHGEMIRSGYDQYLKVDPSNFQYLYQGQDPEAAVGLPYGDLPWRIALLTQTNWASASSACPDAGSSDPCGNVKEEVGLDFESNNPIQQRDTFEKPGATSDCFYFSPNAIKSQITPPLFRAIIRAMRPASLLRLLELFNPDPARLVISDMAPLSVLLVLPLFSLGAFAQVALYGQCGGTGYSGSTVCKEGVCTKLNDFYSQCIPGSATTAVPSTTSAAPTTSVVVPTSTSAPSPGQALPTSFRWTSSGPLISPKKDSRNLSGVKDPSVVYYGGRWHVFATTAKSGNWGMFYTNFTDWSTASSSEFFYLDQSGIGTGYRAAPQVFYFAPQKLWYLVFQNNNAAYSTNPDISNPRGWTAPKTFYTATPRIITQNIGSGYWVDMWVICDSANCHLFSSDDNGHLYRSQTSLANFPNGFGEPVIAMQDSNKNRLFEAANVYRVGDSNSFLLIVEAIGSDNRRWFRSWTSSSISGPWTVLAAEEATPFARANNVAFNGTAWTKDISHGEMVRSGYDQNLAVDPCNMRYLYQGLDPNAGGAYGDLPYRLGLLTQSNSAC